MKRVFFLIILSPFFLFSISKDNNAELFYKKGKVLFEAGFVDDAIDMLQRAIKMDPTLFNAHFLLGKIAFYREDFGTALRNFLACSKKKGFNPDINYFLGVIYLKSGDNKKAIEYLKDSTHPFVSFYYNKIVNLYDIANMDKIKNGNKTYFNKKELTKKIKLFYKEGMKFFKKNRLERAYFFLKKAKDIIKKRSIDYKDTYNVLFYNAKVCIKLGLLDEAEKDLLFLEKRHKTPELYRLLEYIYKENKEYRKLIDISEKLLKFFPDDIVLRGNLAIYYMKRGEELKAIDNLQYILKLESDNVLAHYNIALAYYKIGRMDDAKQHINIIKSLILPSDPVYIQAKILERKVKLWEKTH